MNYDEDSTKAMFSVDLSNLPPYQMGNDVIYDDIAKSTTCLGQSLRRSSTIRNRHARTSRNWFARRWQKAIRKRRTMAQIARRNRRKSRLPFFANHAALTRRREMLGCSQIRATI